MYEPTHKTAKSVNTRNQFAAVIATFRNKLPVILVLMLLLGVYDFLPSGLPFLEVFYTLITVFGCVVTAPILRVLVFNEAAQYAENGLLDRELQFMKFTPAMVHYWFATGICYAIVGLAFASITK